jgi:hypothetical protein
MLIMQHYDAVHTPTPAQMGMVAGKKNQKNVTTQAQHLAYLQQHPYEKLTEEEVDQVHTVRKGVIQRNCNVELWFPGRIVECIVLTLHEK